MGKKYVVGHVYSQKLKTAKKEREARIFFFFWSDLLEVVVVFLRECVF